MQPCFRFNLACLAQGSADARQDQDKQQAAVAREARAALEADVASRIIQQLPDKIPGLYSKPFTTGKIKFKAPKYKPSFKCFAQLKRVGKFAYCRTRL